MKYREGTSEIWTVIQDLTDHKRATIECNKVLS